MLDIHSNEAIIASLSGGILLHILAYRRGEWDLLLPDLLLGHFIVVAGATAFLHLQSPESSNTGLVETFLAVARLAIAYLTGVFGSIFIYRVLFHRLRHFPGPFLARVSNLYPTYLRAKKLHLFKEVEELHRKYGDFVRLGPTELSINHPAAVEAIYSARSPCTKGPFYNVLHPRTPLNMIRDKDEHTARRKIWDRGFSSRAIRDYEPRVHQYTNQLLQRLDELQDTPINASDWFNFYSFDVMGDLAFGKSFDMLQGGVKHYFMKCLHADMTINGYLAHITWIFPLFKIIPILNSDHLKFWTWCAQQVQDRMKVKPENPDVFSWILEDYERNPKTNQAKLNLEGEAYLIAVAGSDTTAATLTNIFFELATHPEDVAALRAELDEYFAESKDIGSVTLSKLQYLNAVINEALRIHPPVPSGLQRVTPPEGIMIGETRIPGNTIVQVPLHTIQKDERNFERPEEFIPARWTSKPELVKNASASAPFSIGLYSCVGKQLGLMELRYVVSQIVHRYDVSFAPGQTRQGFWDSKRDTFTLAVPKLDLIFKARQ